MGIFNFGKTQAGPSGPHFVFADGTTTTPREFGNLALRVSTPVAANDLDSLFVSGKFGASLKMSKAIANDRLSPHLYLTIAKAAVYVWHAQFQLGVKAAIVEEIYEGIRDGLNDVSLPNGKPLESKFKNMLLLVARHFAQALEKDSEDISETPPNTFRTKGRPSTELLIDILCKINTQNERVIEEWKQEILVSPNGLWLRSMMDEITLNCKVIVVKELNVRFSTS